MGIFSLIGGVIGAAKAKKASKKAAAAQIAGMQKGIGEQQGQYDTTVGRFAPYTTAGTTALGHINDLLGMGTPEAQQTAIDQLKASPYYQSLFRTGQETLLQNAAATGGIRGGNTERGLADFGSDTLAQTIQQQLQNLGTISSAGLGAEGTLGGFGQNKAAAVSGLLTGQGQAQAQDYINRGNISANMWKGLGSGIDQMAKDAAMAMAGIPPMGGGGGMQDFNSTLGGFGGATPSYGLPDFGGSSGSLPEFSFPGVSGFGSPNFGSANTGGGGGGFNMGALIKALTGGSPSGSL